MKALSKAFSETIILKVSLMSPPHLKRSSRVTISDVAQKAGVSISTVSRVLNQSAPVTSDLAAKVQAAIVDLDYRPQMAARVLAGQRTNTIGLLLAEIGPDFYPFVIRGVEAAVRERQFKLLINLADLDAVQDNCIPFTLGGHNTDGLLIFSGSLPDEEIVRLHKSNLPLVLVLRPSPEGLQLPCVTIENRCSARELVDHLIEVHGCRRIAFLAGLENNEDATQRDLGYRESLEAHSIPFLPELWARGYFSKKTSYDIVSDWLANGVEFDAIFASDDRSAVGVMSALMKAGRRVPDDVAVVGFDDAEISRYLTPPLTTVRVPMTKIGRESVEILVDWIAGERSIASKKFETELVIRRSCGCS